MPRDRDAPTRSRAEVVDGKLRLVLPAEFHRDPTRRDGALVVTDCGADTAALVTHWTGLPCEVATIADASAGIPHPVEVVALRRG